MTSKSVLAVALSVTAMMASAIEFNARITTIPAVAAVGTERKISVNADWPNACPPTALSLLPEPALNPIRLTLRLNVVATTLPCPQVVTPFALDAMYTPLQIGTLPILVATSDGQFVGQGTISTLSKLASTRDLSGTWIDTNDLASVLMLTQSEIGTNQLVGSWNLFGHDGAPRWQLIHSSNRITSSTIEARLFEYAVAANTGCLSSACPRAGMFAHEVGMVIIEAESTHQITVTAFASSAHPTLPPGTILFRSTMMRMTF
jgi:hypothetical protein